MSQCGAKTQIRPLIFNNTTQQILLHCAEKTKLVHFQIKETRSPFHTNSYLQSDDDTENNDDKNYEPNINCYHKRRQNV